MTDRRIPSAAAVVVASAIGAAGMVAHNVLEFEPGFLGSEETLIPVGVFGLLALLAWARPANTVVHVALLAWALLNLVGGGILSVLLLGIFPVVLNQMPIPKTERVCCPIWARQF